MRHQSPQSGHSRDLSGIFCRCVSWFCFFKTVQTLPFLAYPELPTITKIFKNPLKASLSETLPKPNDFIRTFAFMKDLGQANTQILRVKHFQDLVSRPFQGENNAICWTREISGDFEEIVNKVELDENITVVSEEDLQELTLTQQGQLAREILLNDLRLLTAHGAAPVLNVIKNYDRDDDFLFFPTDVYSYHVDRSPIPGDTILCSYYGEPSEILPNSEVTQKILIPEIRAELKKLYDGTEEGFEDFLIENFFDLHYQAKPEAQAISLGIGHIWRLAIDHPESKVLPCVHRAPVEKTKRLLLIC